MNEEEPQKPRGGGSKQESQKANARGRKDEPRSLAFHWLANMVLASLALFAGALFGERIPQDQFGIAFVAVAAVALALVPVTRYWEKTGIEGRRRANEQAKLKKEEEAAAARTDGKDAAEEDGE